MASRFKLARAGAGITAAAAALMMTTAVPASADPVIGRVDGGALGLNVNVGEGFKSDLSTQLIGLNVNDGTKLGVYCVEIDLGLDRGQPLVEQNWDDYPNEESPFNENAGKINFVLANGFPQRSTAELAKTLTDQGVNLNDGSLSVKEAVAGTQAAIWKFSDEAELNRDEPVPGDARAGQDVLALFDLLTGPDNTGIDEEPSAALQIDPGQKSGTAGERIGPFEVVTTGTIDKLVTNLPDGVRITDAEGRALDANQIVNTSKVFFDVPEDEGAGNASFELTAKADVAAGRLFVAQNYDKNASQSVIVATGEETEVSAKANADWVASGEEEAPPAAQGKNDDDVDDDLATTGASILVPVLIGAGLLVLGGGSLLLMRRRKV
jgi:TQXA domain-containing protein/LPXTG-motif cell wall-anchored protein